MRELTLISKTTILLFLIATPQLAFSQIYKCKSLSGKVIYSEEACPTGTKGSEISLEPNVIDSSALRDRISRDKAHVSKADLIQSNSPQSITDSSSIMSEHERSTRLRALAIDMGDTKAFYEKIADAKNEHNILQSSSVKPLSNDTEIKRRNLKLDLDNPDPTKRSSAYRLLSKLYAEYY